MRKLLFIALIGLTCAGTGCAKTEIKPKEKTILTTIAFRNFTSMEFNYADGCETNIVLSGTTKYLRSGTDTICSFKIDDAGIISWKTRPGHIVTLGGCNTQSLTISQ